MIAKYQGSLWISLGLLSSYLYYKRPPPPKPHHHSLTPNCVMGILGIGPVILMLYPSEGYTCDLCGTVDHDLKPYSFIGRLFLVLIIYSNRR